MKFFTRNFFQGILLLAPLFLTAYIFYLVFMTVDQIGRFILGFWIERQSLITGIGFFVTVALVTLAGYLSSKWFGYPIFNWLETQFMSSKITKGIYGVIQDTLGAIFGGKKMLTKVALVDFPELGYKRIGFVTQESFTALDGHLSDYAAVYFPHSFQVSGNLLIVPSKNIQILDMPTETAFKLIMSGGIARG